MTHNWQRQLFRIKTDTGVAANTTRGDTGPAFFGSVEQVRLRWADTGVADTGASVRLSIHPENGDTGGGWNILSMDNVGLDWTKVPRQNIHNAAGVQDTGPGVPHVAAGDHLRITMTGDKSLVSDGPTAQFYIWTKG